MTSIDALCPGCFAEKGDQPTCPACGYDETASRPPLLLPHRTILQGDYLVGRTLGDMGGFSITYLAWKISLEVPVAIKEFLPRDLASRSNDGVTVYPHTERDQELFAYGVEGFVAEGRRLARFDHPNIMRVRHLFEENATAYMVMDYYEGLNLKQYLAEQGGRLSERAASAIMMPILDGLRHVHEKGFLHRDVKPSNIYLKQRKIPILLDFGSARIALGERNRSLSVVLTEGYAPFEQYHRQGKQGRWTDVYGCAATLYHLVTGKPPLAATERMAGAELAPPDGVSASFSAAVQQALAIQPEERTQSIEDLQQELMADAPPKPAPPKPAPPKVATPAPPATMAAETEVARPKAPRQGTRWVVAAALIGFSLLGLALLISLRPSSSPPVAGDEPAAITEDQPAQSADDPAQSADDPPAVAEDEPAQSADDPPAVAEDEPAQSADDPPEPPPAFELRAANDFARTEAGQPVEIRVLANDQVPEVFDLVIASRPSHGDALLNDDRTVVYRPDPRYARGRDNFTYELTAGSQVAAARVTIEIRPRSAPPPRVRLRSRAIQLTPEAAKIMVIEYGFYDDRKNPGGAGVDNAYVDHRDGTITDLTTGLMWQESGSDKKLVLRKASAYVDELNRTRFAGHSDWRLPTVEELYSLLEPAKLNKELHIDPTFSAKQVFLWSADSAPSGNHWYASLGTVIGWITPGSPLAPQNVRAVRTR